LSTGIAAGRWRIETMPIEFRCTHCDRLLRTPDGTSGKEAKCPQCGGIVRIPDQGQTPSAPPPPAPELSPHVDSGNPYQSPAATTMAAGPQGEVHRGFHPTRIDLADMLSRTWQIFKANLWPCVGAAAPVVLLGMVQNGHIRLDDGAVVRVPPSIAFALSIVQFWLLLGLLTYLLKVARGEPASFSDVFTGGPVLLPALGVGILLFVVVVIGFLLFCIPGFVVLTMFLPAILILIDQHVGVIDSLKMAKQATTGNKLTLFGMISMVGMGGLLFSLLTCLLGTFFAAPFIHLLFCVSYLAMTGQSTADQLRSA
jgi:phage FluMu protein Com